ncbi:HAD superfamily hydrolase (TIGR01549 family) [Anaerosolibacter carboniphilus]|uniref:HAD superfamily hydrolase (TIGR01549 family) n=1 Tax=Anaerosolibacter carboniphilus TaxID=1417629 RepID=A0A841KMY9_9FIRM|nr:HAD-IA family hydrolase [Anaerosolibacter carboniphilus]MBB6214763.1 HAD superfamily hydrolase (TIGR01549 family) [Anaerosolibacter carboniphilus]
MIKLIIFDYDGVIVDSFSNVYDVYKIICDELVVTLPDTVEEFRKIYGYDFRECYKNLGLCSEKQKRAMEIFEKEIITKKPDIFDGVKEVLEWARERYTLTLVSSNFLEEISKKLKSYDIENYFSMIVSSEMDKTKEFITILEKYNLKGDEVIVIGDRISDYDSGKKAGIEHILLVEYGWGYDKHKFPECKFIINEPLHLIDAIREIDK